MSFIEAYSRLLISLVFLSAVSLVACSAINMEPGHTHDGLTNHSHHGNSPNHHSNVKAHVSKESKPEASLNKDGQLVVNQQVPLNYSMSTNNLWEDLGNSFSLQEHYTHHRVQAMLERYQNNQIYFNRLQPNAKRYLAYIVQEARRRNVPLEIALLPVIESTLNPFAISTSNAVGLWQFIYSTGKLYDLKNDTWVESRRDVVASTTAGLNHLVDLYYKFGDWLLAMAAYNAGPGAVTAAINANKAAGLPTDYWSLDMSTETEEYVPKILALSEVISNPQAHNVHLSPISTTPDFKRISMRGKFDLSQLAHCAKMHVSDFYRYNPSFNQPHTPDREFIALVPKERFQTFLENFKNYNTHCTAQHISQTNSDMQRVRGFSIKQPSSIANITPLSQPSTISKPSIQVPKVYDPDEEIILVKPPKQVSKPVSKPKNKKVVTKPKVKKKPAASNARRPSAAGSKTRSTSSGKTKSIHVVKPGETLWRISYNNGIKLSDLMRWNNLSDKTQVKSGSRLVIWK